MDNQFKNYTKYQNFLSDLALFEKISDQDLVDILSLVKLKQYQKGEILRFDVEKQSGLYITYTGQLKLTKINQNGEEMVLSIVAKKGIICPMYFSQYYDASIEIVNNASLLYFSEDIVNKLIESNSIFSKNVINMLAENVQSLMLTAEMWRLKNTKEKLGWFLASANANNLGKLPVSKSLLASYLGMTPESLSRALKKLNKEGIHIESKTIKQTTGKELCAYCDKIIGSNCELYGSKECALFLNT